MKKKAEPEALKPNDIVYFSRCPSFKCSCVVRIISIGRSLYRVKRLLYNCGGEPWPSGCTTVSIDARHGRQACKASQPFCEFLKLFAR